jgi:L-aminopeptidase/D-esterase-like protein
LDDITSIRGVRVGHGEDRTAMSGVTVVLLDRPSVTACDARGGWPGSYDTASIEVGKTFYRKQAIFLTGGDVFGYDSGRGIRRFLVEKKIAGSSVGDMPEVVGTNIYDLSFAKHGEGVDYADLGYEACLRASSGRVEQGNVGVGLGATVGKLLGSRYSWKGGLGTSASRILGDVIVGAIVATNAVGNVFDPDTGRTIAGTRKPGTKGTSFCELNDVLPEYVRKSGRKRDSRATTVGVVITNLALTHEQTFKVAQMAHDGLARVIRPVHATTDGDTIFAVSTGEIAPNLKEYEGYKLVDALGETAAQQASLAVLSAVRHASPFGGIPGLSP